MASMILQIGTRSVHQVASVSEAVELFEKLRDESREGASTWPDGVLSTGAQHLRISYNGRVWDQGIGVEIQRPRWQLFRGTYSQENYDAYEAIFRSCNSKDKRRVA